MRWNESVGLMLGVLMIAGCPDPDGKGPDCVGFECDTDTEIVDPDTDTPTPTPDTDTPTPTPETPTPTDTPEDTAETDPPTPTPDTDDSDTDTSVADSSDTDTGPDDTHTGPVDTDDSDTDDSDTDDSDTDTDTDTGPQLPRPDDLNPGDLVITEFNARPGNNSCILAGEYVEIYNASGQVISIDGLVIEIGSRPHTVSSSFIMQPGEYATTQREILGVFCDYTSATDFTYGGTLALGDNGDVIRLLKSNGDEIDTVDYSTWSTSDTVVDRRSTQLLASAVDATSNDLESNWCPTPDGFPLDPFNPNADDMGDPDNPTSQCWTPPVNTPTPTPGGDTDTGDTGEYVPVGVPIDQVNPGDLFITELLFEPAGCNPASDGVYFEVYNASAVTIDLRGLQFDWGVSPLSSNINVEFNSNFRANSALVPGESVAIVRAGSNCHLIHAGFEFNNSLSTFRAALRIHDGVDTIHSVDFNAIAAPPPGTSVGFDGSLYSQMSVEIADVTNWCPQVGPLFSGSEGTPNQDNSACTTTGGPGTGTGMVGPPGRDTSDGLDAEELLPGELVITEIFHESVDCASSTPAQYLEVYNASPHVIRPATLKLDINPVAPNRGISVIVGQVDEIQPGEYAIISRNSSATQCWSNVERRFAVQTSGMPGGEYTLRNTFGTIDTVDLTGFPVATGQSSSLDPALGVPEAGNNDAIANWCYGDAVIQAGSDRGTPNGSNDCAPPPNRCDDGIISAGEAQPADLVITEVMFESDGPGSQGCGAAGGEYVEVFVTAECDVAVGDFRIDLGAGASNQNINPVDPGVTTVAPGSYALIYHKSSPGLPYCDGADPEFFWPLGSNIAAFTVNGGPALVSITDGAVTIDTVDFTGFVEEPGWAIMFDPAVADPPDAAANNDWMDWCRTVTPTAAGSDNNGTPGVSNVCDRSAQFMDTGDTDETDVPDPDATIEDLVEGHLVITELMELPNCGAARGQYIEIYNSSNLLYELDGLEIEINGNVDTVSNLQIASGDYQVFIRDNANRCGVQAADADYIYASNLALNNAIGNDVVTLRVPAAAHGSGADLVVDVVDTTFTANFPWGGPAPGQSRQLDAARIDSFSNNSPFNWCVTDPTPLFRIGAGADYGTPGGPNNPCISSTFGVTPPTFNPTADTAIIETGVPLTNLSEGDIVITEFMVAPTDCPDEASAEYIEILNVSGSNINLDELVVADSDATYRWTIQSLVADGERALIVNTPAPGNDDCYPDLDAAVSLQADTLDNVGDRIRLENANGQLLDEVEFFDWQLSLGRAWELNPATENANANNSESNWCLAVDLIPGAISDRGTPNQPNTACASTDVDPPGSVDVDSLSPGDLVITEIMVNPETQGCTDANSEYFEIYNASASDINLEGLRISNQFQAQYDFAIQEDVVVAAGEYAVLARFDNPRCYALPVAAYYGVIRLDNSGDVLRIGNANGALDVVDFRVGFDLPPEGVAWELDDGATDVNANDDPSVWCGALDVIAGGSDLGTPGTANGGCYTDSGNLGVVDTDDTEPPPVDPGFGLDGVDVATLGVGDLVITEVMVDPYDCPDGQAEYIEILNTTGDRVELDGLVVTTAGGTHTVSGASTVGAGDYAVGIRADISPQCYGLVSQFSYTTAAMPNTGGTVSVGAGGTTFDTIDYATFGTQPVGASWTLKPAVTDAAGNDDGTAWCVAGGAIPSAFADRGSPGEANLACSVDPDDTGDGNGDDTSNCAETGDPDACVGDLTSIEDLEVGDLIISEFFVEPRDCPGQQNTAEYIEIYNNTTEYVDVNGLRVSGGEGVFTVSEVLPLVVAPGDYTIAGIDAATACYGSGPDVPFRVVTLNADPGIVFIGNSTTVLDLVDFSAFEDIAGHAWGLDVSRIGQAPIGGTADAPETNISYSGSYQNNDRVHWCMQYSRVPGAVADKGTPRMSNDPVCVQPGELPPYPDDYIAHVDELNGGELVITEMMTAPGDCNDLNGEYIEIRNDGPLAVSLDGLVVQSPNTTHIVSSTAVIGSGDIMVGRRSAATGGCYSGINTDFVFGVSLPNGGGLLELRNGHSLLDAVDSTGWGLQSGVAHQLDPDSDDDAVANDDEANWCLSSDLVPGSSADFGTPGAVNACAFQDTGIDEPLTVGELAPGDLVITEVLKNDLLCGGMNQYIEIYNNTAQPVQLLDLIIEAAATQGGQITSSVVVQPGEVALGVANVFSPCLILNADFFYPGGVQVLPQDVLRLRAGITLIDEVRMTNTAWVNTTGNAWQLDPSFIDATLNDDVASWCSNDLPPVQSTVGPTIGGTPGEMNDCSQTGVDPHTGDSADTGIMRFGAIQGNAVVAAGALYLGEQDRIIGTQNISRLGNITPDCYWQYTQQANRVVNLSSLCPSCQFGFNTVLSNPVDIMANAGLGPSSCGTIFDDFGGVGALPAGGDWTIGLSASYGAVMYQYGSQPFGVLTYDYTYGPPQGFSDPNFHWSATLYSIYY